MKTKAGLSLSTISLLALFITCGLAASAQDPVTQQPTTSAVPNLIRYGGVLKDASGAVLASQTLGVTFALYKQQDGGVALWTETRNVTTNAAGQYSVMLGSTKPEGVTADLFSEQEQRWLGVQVQGQAEQSRVLMVSVPYAFQAHEAETLGGLPASAFVQAAPNATSSGAAAAGLTVNGLNASGNSGSSPQGKGTGKILPPGPCLPVFGYITYWDATGALCKSNLFQTASGYIGIGTTMPSTPLEVNGAITADTWYAILPGPTGELPFLSVGWPTPVAANQNTWLGLYAGGQGSNTTDTGLNNTFTGWAAGSENQTGSNNSFFGALSGFRNDKGSYNTYIGVDVAFTNSGPINNNTFTGYESGLNNTASNGSFYGYKAGAANMANGNSFFGFSAGTANTTGNSNTFLGNLAGTANMTGSGDTFVGDSAGAANVTGNNNTFMGQNAGKANTVSGNSFYGFNSGPVNTSGIQNVFMGYQTGLVNSTGNSNVFVGYSAGQANNQSYNTFVGDATGFNSTAGGNTMIGYSAGSNTTGATGYGIVATGYDAGRSNTVGTLNAYYGVNAGFNGTTGAGATYQVGSNNTYLGNGAGSSINLTTASNNVFVGFAAGNAENNVNNNIEISNSGPAPGSNSILIGNSLHTSLTYMQGIWSTPHPYR